jgi:hypothetical protein
MLGFSQGIKQPFDLREFKWLIDLDGGVAGNGSGNTATPGF